MAELRDFICVSVRVPKSGSESLSTLLADAFAGARTFYLPTTRDVDGELSLLQRLRGARSRRRNLRKHYGTISMEDAYARIADEAAHGDLIDGGHIEFGAVKDRVPKPLKLITILRDPYERSRSEYNYARASYYKKPVWGRFDAGIMPRAAARYNFEGFLDYLTERRAQYANIASRYVGWDGAEDLNAYFLRNVFHSGILEDSVQFVHALSQKVGKPLAFPHVNRTARETAQSVSRAEAAKIERLYARDLTLYAWQRANLT